MKRKGISDENGRREISDEGKERNKKRRRKGISDDDRNRISHRLICAGRLERYSSTGGCIR